MTSQPAWRRAEPVPVPAQPVERLPPHDVVAEEAVIAALMLDEEAFARVSGILKASDFFREQHAWVWTAADRLHQRNETITIPTLAHELNLMGSLDGMGGEPALVEIVGRHFTSQGVEAHARMVLRDATYRRLIQAAGRIAAMAYEGHTDGDRVISEVVGVLGEVVADYGARKQGRRVSTVRGFRL